VFLIATAWSDLWSRDRLTRMACGLAFLVVFWSWLTSCGLMLASLFLPAGVVQRAWAVPLYTSLGTPLVVLCLLTVHAVDRLNLANATGEGREGGPSS